MGKIINLALKSLHFETVKRLHKGNEDLNGKIWSAYQMYTCTCECLQTAKEQKENSGCGATESTGREWSTV